MKGQRELNSLGQCAKYLMFVMNFLFFLLGCAMVGVGIWVLLERDYMEAFIDSPLMKVAAYIVIIGGGTIAVISFVGCIGSLQESKCMIMMYLVAVSIIFLILLVGGILALIFRSQISEEVVDTMEDSLRNHYGVNLDNSYNLYITEAWDKAQTGLDCCAVYDSGWNIYRSSEWYKTEPGIPEMNKPLVPTSCCVLDQDGEYIDYSKCQTWVQGPPARQSGQANEALHYQGCYEAGKRFVWEYTGYLAGIGLGIGLSMVFGMAFAIILYRQLSKSALVV